MADSTCLFGIDAVAWVKRSISKMETIGSTDKRAWNVAWLQAYRDLGGNSSVGEKPCPRAAAYGLWRVMALNDQYDRESWPLSRVCSEFGKNALYSVIAMEILRTSPDIEPKALWKIVQHETRRLGIQPARSEQGEIRLVIALHESGQFWHRANEVGSPL